MKICVKHIIRRFLFALALTMVAILGCKCRGTKPEADPLAGWTYRPFDSYSGLSSNQQHHYSLDKAVTDDYQNFISTNHLSPDGAIPGFFEDGTGQRAVQFEAESNSENASWHYVLIYDRGGKRVKVIKYGYKRYMS